MKEKGRKEKNGKMKRNQTIALGLLAFSREKCENLIIIMSISSMIKIFHGVLEQSDSYIFFWELYANMKSNFGL